MRGLKIRFSLYSHPYTLLYTSVKSEPNQSQTFIFDARRARRASSPPTPKEEAVPFLWLQKYNLLCCSDFVPLLSDPHGWRLPLAGIVGLEYSPVFTLEGIRLPPEIFVTAERRASALDAALRMPGGELVLFPTYHPLFHSTFCTHPESLVYCFSL